MVLRDVGFDFTDWKPAILESLAIALYPVGASVPPGSIETNPHR
jgi:hypothetical protein